MSLVDLQICKCRYDICFRGTNSQPVSMSDLNPEKPSKREARDGAGGTGWSLLSTRSLHQSYGPLLQNLHDTRHGPRHVRSSLMHCLEHHENDAQARASLAGKEESVHTKRKCVDSLMGSSLSYGIKYICDILINHPEQSYSFNMPDKKTPNVGSLVVSEDSVTQSVTYRVTQKGVSKQLCARARQVSNHHHET